MPAIAIDYGDEVERDWNWTKMPSGCVWLSDAIQHAREFVDEMAARAPQPWRSIAMEAAEIVGKLESHPTLEDVFRFDDLVREAESRNPCAEWSWAIWEARVIAEELRIGN